ncbi:DUF2759 domain-containing protein [Aquibacillus halophilus]
MYYILINISPNYNTGKTFSRRLRIMELAIIFLVVAILCAIAVLRELKTKNFFAVAFAGASTLVFGWFSIMTLFSPLFQ